MNYTIAVMEDIHNGQKLDFSKDGNQYVIGLYSEETDTWVSKFYSSLEEAYEHFEKISKAIITGCYSFEQRKQFL